MIYLTNQCTHFLAEGIVLEAPGVVKYYNLIRSIENLNNIVQNVVLLHSVCSCDNQICSNSWFGCAA